MSFIPFMQDPVDPCPGLSGGITQYQIRLQLGSVVITENVNIAECTVGCCSHTFKPPSNPPSSYDSVSVAAENVVGVGAARTCTTQTISELISFLITFKIYCTISVVRRWSPINSFHSTSQCFVCVVMIGDFFGNICSLIHGPFIQVQPTMSWEH